MKPDCNSYRHDIGSDLNSVTDGAVDLELWTWTGSKLTLPTLDYLPVFLLSVTKLQIVWQKHTI